MPIIAPGIFLDDESKMYFFNCQHVLDVLETLGVDLVTRSQVTRELIEPAFVAESRLAADERALPPLRPHLNEQGEWRLG